MSVITCELSAPGSCRVPEQRIDIAQKIKLSECLK